MKLIPFKSFLNELFQQHHDFKKISDFPHTYHFQTDAGHHYHVNVDHMLDTKHKIYAHANFSQLHQHKNQTHEKLNATNDQGHGATKVFSTVHHILKHHMHNNPDVPEIRFSADHSEPQRVKLYQHLAKRFAKKHQEDDHNGVQHFQIRRKDIK